MSLPKIAFTEDEVHGVKIRGLSRAETLKLADYAKDVTGAEAFGLSCAAGVTVEEATAWLADTPSNVAGEVMDRILELSGLTEDAQFQPG